MSKTHTMKSICAWCGIQLGIREVSANAEGKVTHGICEKCKDEVMGEMNDGNLIHSRRKEGSIPQDSKR